MNVIISLPIEKEEHQTSRQSNWSNGYAKF